MKLLTVVGIIFYMKVYELFEILLHTPENEILIMINLFSR